MTIPLIASGGLFTREGHILGFVNAINTFQSTTVTGHISEIFNDYIATDEFLINSLFSQESAEQNSAGAILSYLQQLASNVIVTMVNDDMLQPNNSLSNAMSYLINQMIANSQTVQACAVSASTSASVTNVGNLILTTSVRGQGGQFLENMFQETIGCRVSSDAQSGTARPGSESVRILGQQAASNSLNWLYPLGSGCSVTITAVNAMIQGGGGTSNWLVNGNFETWVGNTPSSWNIIVGAAGSTILKSISQFYDGAASLQFAGSSSELTSINTQFTTYQFAGNISTSILPLNQYAMSAFYRVLPAASGGSLQFALTDAIDNVIADNLGNLNQMSVNLTIPTASWTNISTVFRTPMLLPTKVNLSIRLTSPLPSGSNVFIDHVAFTQMTQLYLGGPYVSIFSANTNSIIGDAYTINVFNNYAGQFQRGFDRLFSMKNLRLLLPSATGTGAPTIPDVLIL